MSSLIGWYTEELRQFLSGRLSKERLDSIIEETCGHLAEAIAHHQQEGLSQRAAEEAAVRAFGTPRRVAYTYLRLSRRRSPVVFTVAGTLLAVICWNTHWLTLDRYFDNFGDVWKNKLCGVFGLVALTLIALGARAAFRNQAKVIIATALLAALVSIPILSYWMVGATQDAQGISRFHLQEGVANVQTTLTKAAITRSLLETGLAAYRKPDVNPDTLPTEFHNAGLVANELGETRLQPAVLGRSLDQGGNYIVPRMFGSFLMVDGRSYVFETMKSPQDAIKAWRTYGAVDLAQLQQKEADLKRLLVSAQQAKNGRLFFFNYDLYGQVLWGTPFLLPLLLLADLLGSLTALPRRARWRPQVA